MLSQVQIIQLFKAANTLASSLNATIFIEKENFRVTMFGKEDYLVPTIGAVLSYLTGIQRERT